MNEVQQSMNDVKNFLWDLREGLGLPVIRRKIQRLGLLGLSQQQQKEGSVNEQPPSTGRKTGLRETKNSFSSEKTPNTCGNNDNGVIPSFTSTNLIRNRFSSGTLCPIRTSISNLLEGASDTARMKAEAELLEKQRQLEIEQEKKKKSESGFHLR